MSSNVTYITQNPASPYDPDKLCARCHHRGTVAFVARGSGVPTIEGRFCFRCWPEARRAAIEQSRRESAESEAAFLAWLQAGGHASHQPEPPRMRGQVLQASWRGNVAVLLGWLHLIRPRTASADTAT